MKGFILAATVSSLILAAVPSANAVELVQNGGFESHLSGWSSSNCGCTVTSGSVAHSGNLGVLFGGVGSNFPLDQTLSTVAGQSYDISYWVNFLTGPPNAVTVSFGGVLLTAVENVTAGAGWIQYTVIGTATSNSTVLEFGLRQDSTFSGLDDVSVTSLTAAVPEPSTWAMMVLGFASLGFMTYRRRQSGSATSVA